MKRSNSGLSNRQKIRHMETLADYRDHVLRPEPRLHSLFLEMTVHCNEHCRHCGSNCGDFREVDPLTQEEIRSFLAGIKNDFPIRDLRLCVTGGEPLLRPDFFEIMEYARGLGFSWGMTSNGTLINKETARRLADTGMRTVSISVDGLRESHEWFRQSPGSWQKSMDAVDALVQTEGPEHIQITTVVHPQNFGELEKMYRVFSETGVKSWRVLNVEPIGRAREQREILISREQLRDMFAFICEKRFAGPMEVCYGCSHFLGTDLEREVRPWYFLCNAGVYTASVTYDGNIVSCLDVERRPELVEGNIRRDRFSEVWKNGFERYRTDFRKCGPCADCEYYRYCAGDSFHSWNFDTMEPNLCMKGILFK